MTQHTIVDIHGEIEGDFEILGKYEERRHGKWVNASPIDDSAECSECGSRGYLSNNYCPDCGAMMEEGDSK